MAKDISANLLTSIRSPNATLAICVEIVRKDGRVIRMTNHDTDLTVDTFVHRHDIPFQISAVSSGSQLQTDNTELTLFASDDGPITMQDFRDGLYDHADVKIYEVDWNNPEYGKLTLRKGWFGPVERNQHRVVKVTVTGLLKILDFEIGRVYQPSCDADLGDSRCKIAIKPSQAYSDLNPYHVGQWVYKYDTGDMTEIVLTNGSFDADGDRDVNQAITDWTKTPNSFLIVAEGSPPPGDIAALDGTHRLQGDDTASDPTAAGSGSEHGVYRDIDLVAEGVSDTDIDNGEISVLAVAALAHTLYLLDPMRIRVEARDADGNIIDAQDTGYITLDDFEVWRERHLASPLFPGTRTLRLFIYFKKNDGTNTNTAADDVRLYWWNHTVGTPYSDAIHQLVRIVNYADSNAYYPTNGSFEANGDVANALSPTITGWVTTGSWWRVNDDLHGSLPALDGNRYLIGGDDGGSSQQTYTITKEFTLASAGIDATRVILGKIGGRVFTRVGWADAQSAATVIIDFMNASSVIQDTLTLSNAETNPTIEWLVRQANFTIPVGTTKIKVTLQATSPVGDGAANIAFDNIVFWFFDAERPQKNDPVIAFGDNVTFDPTPGVYTFDGNLVWKASEAYVKFDTVASVISRKQFTGTLIAGGTGTYETGLIQWVSGANAGLRNVIRTWDSPTKGIKTYFRAPHDIEVGDRFIYIRSCQKRFLEDCLGVFGNGINFRGFPHLPGRLSSE